MSLDFIFITYLIALMSLALGIYAVLSIREIEKRFSSKNNQRKQRTSAPSIAVKRPKGHWD